MGKAICALAVGGAMCLGLGVFAICNSATQQTQIEQTQNDGVLQLVPESAGSTTQGVFLTVSEWNALGTYGSVNSAISHYKTAGEDDDDPAGQAIWKEIQDTTEFYGTVTLCIVTLQLSDTSGNYSTPIQVVAGSPISASANVLTIAGVEFTAPAAQSGYVCVWKLDNASLPERITTDCTIAVTYLQPEPGLYDSSWNLTASWETLIDPANGYCSQNPVSDNAIVGSSSAAYFDKTKLIGTLIISSDVTSIGNYAFKNCSGLTSVTIPNNVTIIGDRAFDYCYGLTSITIPSSVTSIGNYAFGSCTSLTSIIIGSGVESIGDHAFFNCRGLTGTITIPNSVTSIGGTAFSYCTGLTSITIGSDVTSIGNNAFYGCSGLTSITIPNSVTSIGNYAFFDCTGLTSITVENGNTVYDSRDNCNAIIKTSTNELIRGCNNTVIPSDVTSIGLYAFNGCSGLTSISIPDSVTSIGSGAFSGCSGLTGTLTIPNSVTSIGQFAFNGCSGLTSVTIPSSVTSIVKEAFSYCSGLTSITVESGNTVYDSRDNCNAIIATYSNRLIVGCKNTTIPSSVTSIGEDAFSGCSGLTSITIPNSVTSIGGDAFSYCTGLTSITIGSGVTSIESYAFMGCYGLTSVTIGSSVTSIGNYAFYVCSGLTSITVESGNTVYDSRNNCNAIIETSSNTLIAGCKNTVIPSDVTSIGNYAFYYCSGLTSITIPNSVTSIGSHAFDCCYALAVVKNLSSSLTLTAESSNNGYVAYYAKTILTSSSDKDIDDYIITSGNMQYYVNDSTSTIIALVPTSRNISSVDWGDYNTTVKEINQFAFLHCTGLTSITIPSSVKSIGEYAFSSCSGLTSINFTGTIAEWNAITKGFGWNNNVPATTVTCSDGDVTL